MVYQVGIISDVLRVETRTNKCTNRPVYRLVVTDGYKTELILVPLVGTKEQVIQQVIGTNFLNY